MATDSLICEICGGALPAGLGPLFCPVCLLHETQPDETTKGRFQIGSCWVEEEIARGGMGIVYRATQVDLGRQVALKVLPGAFFSSAEVRTRFRAESSAAARLRHPGIVAIHEVGEHDGHPYFTMDLINGPNLDEILRLKTLPAHFSAQLCQRLAEAVHYAHSQGVCHRDIKPSNILLDHDNHPVLTDFGLARLHDHDSQLTLSGQIIGTPSYLAPERAGGKSSPADHGMAGDIYGLGAVLYHMLAGKPPFMGESIPLTLEAVRHEDPVPPRRLRPGLHRDLETICLKCLQKNPSSRYATAADVAADLGRFLRGEPIHATPVGGLTRVIRWVHRRPMRAALMVALALSLLGGVSATLWQSRAANLARAAAESIAELRRAEVYATDILAASIALEKGDVGHARSRLSKHLPQPGLPDLRGFEWYYLEHECFGHELAIDRTHTHILTSLAWSPDGRVLASSDHRGTLVFWQKSTASGRPPRQLKRIALDGHIRKLAWLPDSSRLVVSGPGGSTQLMDFASGKTLLSFPGECFALAAAGNLLAVAQSGVFNFDHAGPVTLYALPSGKVLRVVAPAGRTLAFSPDGTQLAIALPCPASPSEESGMAIHAVDSPQAQPRLIATDHAIWSLQFSPDGTRLAATLSGGDVVPLWNPQSGLLVGALRGHVQRAWSCTFIENGRQILTTGSDRTIRLWDAASLAPLPLHGLIGHENEIWCAALAPSNNLLASGDKDGVLRFWKWPPDADPAIVLPADRYARAAFSPDGNRIFLTITPAAGPSRVRMHDFRSGIDTPLPDYYAPLCIDPAGRRIVIDSSFSLLLCYQNSAPRPVHTVRLPIPAGSLHPDQSNIGITSDGSHGFISRRESGATTLYDLRGESAVAHGQLPAGDWLASAISPDARWIAAATWNDLALLDTHTGKTTTLTNDPHWANAIVFHPDGRRFITAGVDGTLKIWSLPECQTLATLRGHLENASDLALSPDGLTLASIEVGSGIRLWRLDTLREVVAINLPGVLERIRFSPDGKRLAFTVRDKSGKSAVRVLECGVLP